MRNLIARHGLVALSPCTLTFGLLVAGCGSYADEPAATGGTSSVTSTGGTSTGGTSTGGISTGGTPTGGSSTGGTSSGGTSGGTSSGGALSGGSGGGSGGDNGAKAACTNVTACGGDVVGTWTVVDSCLSVTGIVDVSGFGLGCTEVTVTGELNVTGTWTANADGTFTDATTTSGQHIYAVPATCLMVSGTTTICDRLGRAFKTLGFTEAVCLDDTATGGCTCTANANQEGGMGRLSREHPTVGSYSAANNVITTVGMPLDGSSDMLETKYDYCVAANTMTTTVTSLAKAGTATGTVLLQKQ